MTKLTTKPAYKAVIASRIRTIRKESGLSQAKFGERMGVTPRTQARYEAGHSTPDAAYLHILHREFNVSQQWLLSDGPPLVDGVLAETPGRYNTAVREEAADYGADPLDAALAAILGPEASPEDRDDLLSLLAVWRALPPEGRRDLIVDATKRLPADRLLDLARLLVDKP